MRRPKFSLPSLPVPSTSEFRPGMVGRPTIDLFVVVSVVLHFALIALVGDSTGSGERKAFAKWAPISVRLEAPKEPAAPAGIGLKLDTRGLLEAQRGAEAPAIPVAPAANQNRERVRLRSATSLARAPSIATPRVTPTAPPNPGFDVTEPVVSPPIVVAQSSPPKPIPLPSPVPPAVESTRPTELPPKIENVSKPITVPDAIEPINLAEVPRELSGDKPRARALPLVVPAPLTRLESPRIETELSPSAIAPRKLERPPLAPIEPVPAPAVSPTAPLLPAPARLPPVERRAVTPVEPIPAAPSVAELSPPTTVRVPPVRRSTPAPLEPVAIAAPVELASPPTRRAEIARPAPKALEPIAAEATQFVTELAPTTALKTPEVSRSRVAPIEPLADPTTATVALPPTATLRPRGVARSAPSPIEPITTAGLASEAQANANDFAQTPNLRSLRPPADPAGRATGVSSSAASGTSQPKPAAGDTGRAGGDARVAGVPSIVDQVLRSLQPPPTPPPLAPSVSAESLRDRARQLARGDVAQKPRAVVPFPMFAQPKARSEVERAFDKSLQRPDCREQFAGMGLAAVLPLVLSTVRDDLCKW